jgi:hypothetical protein
LKALCDTFGQFWMILSKTGQSVAAAARKSPFSFFM